MGVQSSALGGRNFATLSVEKGSPEPSERESIMVVALVVFALAGGVVGAGSALLAGLSLWAAAAAYLACGSLSAVLLAGFALLRPKLASRTVAVGHTTADAAPSPDQIWAKELT